MSRPRVAVVMAYYQPITKYVRQAIESIRAQTAYHFVNELILVNDGGTPVLSPTDTWPVPGFEGIVEKLVRHPENRGQGAALNMALRLLEPESSVVAFLDADDMWAPAKLECQWEVMQRRRASAVYGGVQHVGASFWRGDPLPGEEAAPARLLGATIVKRDALVPFREDLGAGTTLEWFSRLEGVVAASAPVALYRRIHGDNYGIVHRERARAEYLRALEIITSRRAQRRPDA